MTLRLWAALILLGHVVLTGPASAVSVFHIPRMPKPPVIDGRLGTYGWPHHEWGRGLTLMGFTTMTTSLAAPVTQQQVWIGYDRDALYVLCSVSGTPDADLKCVATAHDSAVWMDESVELHVGVGREPSRMFQFVVNANGAALDAINEGSKHIPSWNGEWARQAGRSPATWEAEMAIPWKTLGLAAAEAGQELRLNIMHNNAVIGKTDLDVSTLGPLYQAAERASSPSDWRVAPLVVLAGQGPVGGATFVISSDDKPAISLRTFNGTDRDMVLEYSLGDGGWTKVNAPAAAPAVSGLPREQTQLDANGLGEKRVRIRDAAGTMIFDHVVRYRSRIGSSITLRKYFPVDYVEFSLPGRLPAGARAVLVVQDAAGKDVSRRETALETGAQASVRLDVSAWAAEVSHSVTLTVLDPKGGVITERSFAITKPARPAWLGTDAGETAEPLPPYTPIVVSDAAFSCLLKDYAFGRRALPVSIKSEGHELLAAPIRMEVTHGAQTVDLADAAIRVSSARPARVEWASETRSTGAMQVTHRGWMEEDGFMWLEVDIDADPPVNVDRLDILVPVRREMALFYNGSMPIYLETLEEVGRLPDTGHAFSEFTSVISVLNYERGLSVVTDDPRPWRPKDLSHCQRIEVDAASATIRYGVIEKPVTLKGRTTFSLGLMAMPAKPVDRKQSARRTIHDVLYRDATRSHGLGGASRVEYPVGSVLNAKQGTVELFFYQEFDATRLHDDPANRDFLSQWLWQVNAGGANASLYWNAHTRGLAVSRSDAGRKVPIVAQMKEPVSWQAPGWRHVALSWGDSLRLYADGVLVAEAAGDGLLSAAPEDIAKAVMSMGKTDPFRRAEIRLAGLRISGKALAPSELALDGRFAAGPATVFLQDFSAATEGKSLPAPAVGQPGGIHDDARIEIAHGRPTLTFGPIPDLTAIENAAKLGVKTLNYHGYWSSDFGLPIVPDERRPAMKALLDACRKHDIRLNLYFGYGLGHAVPESRLYDDYWGIEPRTFWGLDMGRFGFVVANNAVQYYTDYMLDGIQTLFREWPIGGMYYDHVQTPQPDQNPHNGSGWIDEYGKLRTRVQVRPARRFIKRLYAITKQANPDNVIDSHGSTFVNPIRAAWVDTMWIGELFRPTNHKFDFDIVTAKCVGAPYGMPSDFLVMSEGLPFDWHKEWHRSLTYTLPHDVEPRALLPYSYRLQRDTMAKLWEIKGAFDTENAEWWPYWKNGDYATVTGKACVTSFHLHRGRRALVVVSNISGEGPVETTLQLDLAAMGLQGRARDAWTGEAATLDQGRADLRLDAHDMRLLWVE